ncbi:MAG TPA: hypothetical protein VHM02_03255, partial [Thermoanaerobaculia bacterium]|nr:hypothetical protein [Thermoanaerobaculia bacterium]
MSTMRTSIAVVSLLLAALPGVSARGAEAEALRSSWHAYVESLRAAGGAGVVYLPTALAPDGERVVLDPRGFHVHLVDPDRPGDERVHPAGEPFVPPPGRWRIWLEGEGRMSQASGVSIFPPEERSSRGLKTALAEVAPAGRVTPWPVAELPARTELWLLAAGNDPLRFELSRRRPFSQAADGVPMPAGRTLAAAWDPESERYVALSPPFEVVAGETVPAPLAPPAPGRSGYVAYVEHPTPQERDSHHGVELVVATGEGDFEPDATATTAWGLHAVWSDLPPGPAEVRGGNALLYLPPVPVELAEDAIGDLRETLAPRPLLDVTLVLPREVRERPFWLAVEEAESGRRLARVQMRRDAGRHRFRDGLEQALVEVVLETHLGRFRRRVDLRAAPEAFVELAPDLIELAGTVTRGGLPHPARVRFQTVAGDLVEAAAGEDGRYRAVALQPLVWIDVELAGVHQE